MQKRSRKKRVVLRRLNLCAVAITIILGTSLSSISRVFATSAWDSAILVASSTKLRSVNGLVEKDLSGSYGSFIHENCTEGLWNSFKAAVNSPDGKIAVVTESYATTPEPDDNRLVLVVGWITSPTAEVNFYEPVDYASVPTNRIVKLYIKNNGGEECADSTSSSMELYSPAPMWDPTHINFLSYPIEYPTGYDGAIIPTMGMKNIDTDGDGLSDFVESPYFPYRDEVFCDTSTSPYTCAYPDPNKKDLYVQIDWLNDWAHSYKPTSTQLGLVSDKFSDMGINFHADTGDYGGGNAISVFDATAATTMPPGDTPGDFYHHKYGNGIFESSNFDAANRYKIWHYMISGYNFDAGNTGDTMKSGVAEGGGDDAFISYGLLASTRSGSTLDNAIAGTIVHELGHNLCLTKSSYSGQDASCLFADIDTAASSNYQSAMNYTYQFTNTYPYSDGTHSTGDHDDISAINVGMDDFVLNDDDSSVGGPI